MNLIEKFLKPAGKCFVDELRYRFLVTQGDSLGGKIRNLAGKLGEVKFTKILMSELYKNRKIFIYRCYRGMEKGYERSKFRNKN